VHRRVVDETTKHVGSTAMGPTKANRSKETEHKRTHTWHSRDFFPEIAMGSTSFVCEEEGWIDAVVHRLSRIK
jgi:hypothetical protein